MGILNRLKEGLTKTRKNFAEKVESIIRGRKIDAETLEELEEALILADLGIKAATEITDFLKEKAKRGETRDAADIKQYLKDEMKTMLGHQELLETESKRPYVIMVVGVNGVGKTTTIGKLSHRFVSEGKGVMLAAADTFRAAAVEQLELWSKKTGAQIVKGRSGSDPAAVAFDAAEAAVARGLDVVIVDTAGRLHTKSHLMEELKKVRRVIDKAIPGAPHEVLLVVDATTGQNALRQAELFNEAAGVTGIALTKLDGTARGGIVFAIKRELGIPIRLIGVGEGTQDLKDFDPAEFVEALFS